jgi:hypothetical protein
LPKIGEILPPKYLQLRDKLYGVTSQTNDATIIDGVVKRGNIRINGRQFVRVHRKFKQSKYQSDSKYCRTLSDLIVVRGTLSVNSWM